MCGRNWTSPASRLAGWAWVSGTGIATRWINEALQGDAFAASATASAQQVKAEALSTIDSASGSPGSGGDLGSLVGAVRDSFSQLSADPANQTQQALVVQQAGKLARGLNALASTLSGVRQSSHDAAVDDVAAANEALRSVGDLSLRITQAQSRGESTAGLEDARDTSLKAVADLTGARFLHGAKGDVLVVAGGLLLPIHASAGTLQLAPASIGPSASGTPRLLLNNQDITGQLTGGRLGAHLALRDGVVPGLQQSLDTLAQRLASRFDAAGLTLFTDPAGAVPTPAAAGGFAATVRVSSLVEADPTRVRDGAGPAGAVGSTTLIDTVLDTVLGVGPAVSRHSPGMCRATMPASPVKPGRG